MSFACARASISIAWSMPTFHSSCSILFVTAWAALGPLASSFAMSRALARGESESWLKQPPASPPPRAVGAAGEEKPPGPALADDARKDRAGTHVAAGEADAHEEERHP